MDNLFIHLFLIDKSQHYDVPDVFTLRQYFSKIEFWNGLWLETCSGVLPREPMPSNITVRLPSLDDLEAYALGQWEVWTSSICFCSLCASVLKDSGDIFLLNLVLDVLWSLTASCNWSLYAISWYFGLLLSLTCKCVSPVFLAATYKLHSNWKTHEFQLFFDESFPAWSSDSKVLPYFFATTFELEFLLCTWKVVIWYLILYYIMCACTFYTEKKKLHG